MGLPVFFHVFFLGLWGGCVAVEMLLEFSARRDPKRTASVARAHDKIDRFIELPILAGILISGALLLDRRPADSLYYVKIAAALGAILANFLCVIPVVRRKRAADAGDERAMLHYSRHVFLAFFVGFPCAAVALGIGLYWIAG